MEVAASTKGKQVLEINGMSMDVDNNTSIKLKPWKVEDTKPAAN
jgi:hypothetical protein